MNDFLAVVPIIFLIILGIILFWLFFFASTSGDDGD